MGVIGLATAVATGVTQDRRGAPSTCTVHAPHRAIPKPNFVPVRPTSPGKTQSRGMSGEAFPWRATPLMVSFMDAILAQEEANAAPCLSAYEIASWFCGPCQPVGNCQPVSALYILRPWLTPRTSARLRTSTSQRGSGWIIWGGGHATLLV